MQTLTDIWKRREYEAKKISKFIHSGFDLRPRIIRPEIRYEFHEPYYIDWTLFDLQTVLENLLKGKLAATLSANKFTISSIKMPERKLHYLQSKSKQMPITIIATTSWDYSQFTIYLDDDVLSLSWINRSFNKMEKDHKGGIDQFLNTKDGQPVTIEEVTDILVALGLEDDYDHDEFNYVGS